MASKPASLPDNEFFEPLCIVGTNHISTDSQTKITEAFVDHDPDLVAVELDEERLASLRRGDWSSPTMRLIPRIGVTGYVFVKITYLLQRYLGRKVGVMPGAEMLHAADLAQKHGRSLRLIDQQLQRTLRTLTDSLGFREKARMAFDVITSPFRTLPVDIDPGSIPDEEALIAITAYLENRYPSFYKAIIADRDRHMAKQIFGFLQDDQRVLAVVGAAHKNGLKKRLHELYQANPTST